MIHKCFNRYRGLKVPSVKNRGIESSDLKFYVCIICFKSASDSLRKRYSLCMNCFKFLFCAVRGWLFVFLFYAIHIGLFVFLFCAIRVSCCAFFSFTFFFSFKFVVGSILCMYLPVFILQQIMIQSHWA